MAGSGSEPGASRRRERPARRVAIRFDQALERRREPEPPGRTAEPPRRERPPPRPGGEGLRERLRVGLAAGGIFLLLLGAALLLPGASYRTEALVRQKPNASVWASAPVVARTSPSGERVLTLDVEVAPEARLEEALGLAVSVDLYTQEPGFYGSSRLEAEVRRAEVEVAGAGVSFRAEPGSRLRDNRLFEFQRVSGAAMPRRDGPVRLRLEWVLERVDLGLALKANRSRRSAPGAEPASAEAGDLGWMRVVEAPPPGTAGRDAEVLYLTGQVRLPLTEPAPARWRLLAYVWGLPGGGAWIAGLVVLAAAAVGGGAGLWPVSLRAGDEAVSEPPGASARAAMRAAAAAGLLFAGFGFAYAVAVPPFHAPDEPVHFLSYAERSGRTELLPGALQLAQRGHFERIKYRYYEKFSLDHARAPELVGWNETIAVDLKASQRYSTILGLWALLDGMIGGGTASSTLLALRVANVLVVAAGIGLGFALWASVMRRPGREALRPFGLFLIPTYPFLAMHVSNYVLVFAGGGLLAVAWLAQWMGERRRWWIGLGLGLGAGLAAHAARSAMPLAGLAPCLLGEWLARLLGRREEGDDRGPAFLAYWGALAAGLLATHVLVDAAYRESAAAMILPQLPEAVRGMVSGLGFVGTVLVGVAVLAGGDALARVLGRRMGEPARERAGRVVSRLYLGLAGAVGLSLIWTSLAPLVPFEGAAHYPEFGQYLLRTVLALWSSFGFGDHDFLTSVSVWSGFGWLDARIPGWVVSVLSGGFCLGLGLAFWQAGREADGPRLGRLTGLMLGWAAYLVVLARGTYSEGFDVGGRYALVLYLLLVMVAFQGWARATARSTWSAARVRAVLLVGTALLHGGSLASVLGRYF